MRRARRKCAPAWVGIALILASGLGCRTSRVAPDTAAADDERVQARRDDIAACFEAMGETQGRSDVPVDDIVMTCRLLWLDDGCRDAWSAALAAPPESRAESVIAGCARSICPARKEPRPQLCERDLERVDLLAESPDWAELWKAFNADVLVEDLGLPPGDTRGEILAMRLLQLVAISRPSDLTPQHP